METKKPWESKTMIMGALTALAPFCPPIQAFIVANPTVFTFGMGLVFTVLRLVTKNKISIS